MTKAPKHELRAIPEPMLEFFRSVFGQSLIVRGESGTGRTALVTSLLEDLLLEHYESKHFIYVTSRMPSRLLSTHFSSFKAAVLPDGIIDATRFVSEKKGENSLVVTDETSFLKLLKKWIGKNANKGITKYPCLNLVTRSYLTKLAKQFPVEVTVKIHQGAFMGRQKGTLSIDDASKNAYYVYFVKPGADLVALLRDGHENSYFKTLNHLWDTIRSGNYTVS